jgi:hypothetical protein
MEVYILDNLYRRNVVVDRFESLIWTERFSAYGNFELILHSTLENRNRFKEGVRLALNESYRVMTVETVEDGTDSEGRMILKVTGRSLEEILDNRLARGTMDDLEAAPKWVLTGLPKVIANKIFHDICVTGILNAGDIIPGVIEASLFPPDTIDAPTETITYEIDPKTVYTALKELCDIYNMGFRLIRNFDTGNLYFDVYTGSDRTPHQSVLPAVVFSPGLDNLQNTTELSSIALYKNVAYVLSPVGTEIVYALDVDPASNGFTRKVLIVKADDIKDTTPSVATAKMIQRGTEELAKNRRFAAFDGELNQNSQYKYGVHYNLGDLVQLRNNSGAASDMQVTEQIFVSDKEGDRSYPTLSINRFITPGSWLSVPNDQVWADRGGVEDVWGTQP